MNYSYDALEFLDGSTDAHIKNNIIVISGNDYEEVRQQVFNLGVKVFIGKPFHVEQIVKVLTKLFA